MELIKSSSAFDEWFHSEITPLVDPAWMDVHQVIESRLAQLTRESEDAEGLKRDRWEVFAPHPIKSSSRVRTKLLANGNPPATPDELRVRVLELGDLARLRIVASLKRDVAACLRALIPAGSDLMVERFPVRGLKDFVRDEAHRRPLAGHRATQFVVEVRGNDNNSALDVRVEIQIMTSLQHVWDRRNHCIYEWLRAGDDQRAGSAIELRVDDHAIAETLHVADALADYNFEVFLRMRREAP